jgi:hypothetical protein
MGWLVGWTGECFGDGEQVDISGESFGVLSKGPEGMQISMKDLIVASKIKRRKSEIQSNCF